MKPSLKIFSVVSYCKGDNSDGTYNIIKTEDFHEYEDSYEIVLSDLTLTQAKKECLTRLRRLHKDIDLLKKMIRHKKLSDF